MASSSAPGRLLPIQHFNSDLKLLDCARVDDPHHAKTRFPRVKLDTNDVAHRQGMLKPREQCPLMADIAGARVLRKGMSIAAHSENADRKIRCQTRFRAISHSAKAHSI